MSKHKDLMTRRADALAHELGSISLARVTLEAHDRAAALDVMSLLSTWFTRDLTAAEFFQMREAAHRLGINLHRFDEHCLKQETKGDLK